MFIRTFSSLQLPISINLSYLLCFRAKYESKYGKLTWVIPITHTHESEHNMETPTRGWLNGTETGTSTYKLFISKEGSPIKFEYLCAFP